MAGRLLLAGDFGALIRWGGIGARTDGDRFGLFNHSIQYFPRAARRDRVVLSTEALQFDAAIILGRSESTLRTFPGGKSVDFAVGLLGRLGIKPTSPMPCR
jgi:hypothetical protein